MEQGSEKPEERPDSPVRRAQQTLAERVLGTGARGAARVAGATGIDRALELAAEEAIVRAFESPAVEHALIRVLDSPAVEDRLDRALESPAVERALESPAVERALTRALDSELVDRLWQQLLASEEVQQLVERIAQAPEVRAAITAQSVGLLQDFGRELRRLTRRLDSGLERLARRILRRPLRSEPTDRAGFVSRGVALAIDAVFLDGAYLAVAGLVALLVGVLFPNANGAVAPLAALGIGFWIIAGSAYLVLFWALAGQTPGMRFLALRLEAGGSRRIGFRCALRRLGGTALAVLTLGVGYLVVLFSRDRRSLPDMIAGTEVLYADPPARTAPWSVAQPDSTPPEQD